MNIQKKYKNVFLTVLFLLLFAVSGAVLMGIYKNAKIDNAEQLFEFYAEPGGSVLGQNVYVMEDGNRRYVTSGELQNGFLDGKTFYVEFTPERALENGILEIPLGQAMCVIFKGEEILYRNGTVLNAAPGETEFQEGGVIYGMGYYLLELETGEYGGETFTMALRFPQGVRAYVPGVTYYESYSREKQAVVSAFPTIQQMTLLVAGGVFFGIILTAIGLIYKRLHLSVFFFLFFLLLAAYRQGYLIFYDYTMAIADAVMSKVILLQPVSLLFSFICLIAERHRRIAKQWIFAPVLLSGLCTAGSVVIGAISLQQTQSLYAYQYGYYILQIAAVILLAAAAVGARKAIPFSAYPICAVLVWALLFGVLTNGFYAVNHLAGPSSDWLLNNVTSLKPEIFAIPLNSYVMNWTAAALFAGILTDFLYHLYLTAGDYGTTELMLENSKNELARIQDNIRETAMLRHDMSKHLETMDYYLDQKDPEAAKRYLNSIIDLPRKGSEYVRTPNFLVNALLNSRISKAKEEGCEFEIRRLEIPETLKIQDKDIGCVLLNLLDNALKSCSMQKKGEKRAIQLTMYLQHHFLYIAIKNTKSRNYKASKHTPHYGLKIIEQTAENYGGSMRVKNGEETYEAEVLMKENEVRQQE